MKRGRAEAIYDEVRSVVQSWGSFGAATGVSAEWIEEIGRNLRVDLLRD